MYPTYLKIKIIELPHENLVKPTNLLDSITRIILGILTKQVKVGKNKMSS